MKSGLNDNTAIDVVSCPPIKQHYLVTIQRNQRKYDDAQIGDLATLALREIPDCTGVRIVGRTQIGVEASFWADAYRITCALERHLNHFGLTWISLELLDVTGDAVPEGLEVAEPMRHSG